MEQIKKQLQETGYNFSFAIATESEIAAGAACGQLGIIEEQTKDN